MAYPHVVENVVCVGGGLEKFKNKNMVNETNKTTTKDGKIIWIKEQLNCRNYGIYQANCRICMKSYVGQTKTTFTKRWTQHRSKWKQLNDNEGGMQGGWNDEQALYGHFVNFHRDKLKKNFGLEDAYTVKFLEQPRYDKLDIQENYWIGKIKAEINISRTFLPKIK